MVCRTLGCMVCSPASFIFLEGNCRVPCCRQLDGPCSHISHEGSQSDSVGFGAIAEVLQVLSTLHPVIPVHHTRTK